MDKPERSPTTQLPDDGRPAHRIHPWERVGKLIRPLLAAAAELHGVATLADLLAPECNRLASKMGIAADIEAIGVDDVIDGTPGPASVVSTRLALTLDTLSPRQRTIIEHRILCTPPKTLEEVGAELGVTRERIRQIQSQARGEDSDSRWDRELRAHRVGAEGAIRPHGLGEQRRSLHRSTASQPARPSSTGSFDMR